MADPFDDDDDSLDDEEDDSTDGQHPWDPRALESDGETASALGRGDHR